MSLAAALNSHDTVIAAELRPPRAELGSREGMDAWIDMYHAVRSLARRDVRVFLTDSAVGTQEENNLRHLVTNLGRDVARDHVIPFLTSKHSLEFCLSYAEQAWQHGFPSLVVLGGDKSVGRARCVEHAWQLRAAIRAREPRLTLGGWANPYGDAAQQVDYMTDDCFNAEYLPHADRQPPGRRARRALHQRDPAARHRARPACSASSTTEAPTAKTLAALSQFLPVPVEGLSREFAAGATPIDICARTLRAMMDVGARHFYISNLPLLDAASTLNEILDARRHGVERRFKGRARLDAGAPLAPPGGMKSTASFHAHPIHPMIVPFPFVFLTGGWGFGVAGEVSGNKDLKPVSRYLVPAGLAAGLLAAVPGVIDYLGSVPPKSSAKERATRHALLNVTSLALVLARLACGQTRDNRYLPLALQSLGVTTLSTAGWLGGTLVVSKPDRRRSPVHECR